MALAGISNIHERNHGDDVHDAERQHAGVDKSHEEFAHDEPAGPRHRKVVLEEAGL